MLWCAPEAAADGLRTRRGLFVAAFIRSAGDELHAGRPWKGDMVSCRRETWRLPEENYMMPEPEQGGASSSLGSGRVLRGRGPGRRGQGRGRPSGADRGGRGDGPSSATHSIWSRRTRRSSPTSCAKLADAGCGGRGSQAAARAHRRPPLTRGRREQGQEGSAVAGRDEFSCSIRTNAEPTGGQLGAAAVGKRRRGDSLLLHSRRVLTIASLKPGLRSCCNRVDQRRRSS